MRRLIVGAQSLYQNMKDSVGAILRGKSARVSSRVYEERLAVCKGCTSYVSSMEMCVECFCNMPIKAQLRSARCPQGYWKEES